MTAVLAEAASSTGGHIRRHRSTLLIVVGLLLAVAVTMVAAGGGTRRTGALDPDNPDPAGAQAIARVLVDQGVGVTVVRDADSLDRTTIDADTTVLVTSAGLLGKSTIARLVDHTGDATLVVTQPDPGTTHALGVVEEPYAVAPDTSVPAACADPAYGGLSIAIDSGFAYPVDGGCFTGPHGSFLAQPRAGLVLLGAGDVLSNDQVLRADNAAVALRLLGQHDRLVWYVPSLDDLVGDDGVSLATLLPRWLRPALWLGAIAVVALLLWRIRRLGALATEPLPVVVKAIETTRSRGRLYRRAGDRAHAADTLRASARVRAADRLGLGTRADPATLVRDLARHTGRPVEELDRLLGPAAPVPTTDHDLITLATRLAELDREVRRP